MGIVPLSSEEKFLKPWHVPKKFYALKMFKLKQKIWQQLVLSGKCADSKSSY